MRFRLSTGGSRRTVYVEHGVWYDPSTKHIHVTVPGFDAAHWSYGSSDKKYALYRAMLEEAGRWPDGADG